MFYVSLCILYVMVIKIFVKDIQSVFADLLRRGTVPSDALRLNTPWNTHEFGCYDLNRNAVFFVEMAN